MGEISLVTTDGGDNHGKNYRFNKTTGDVFHLDRGLHSVKICTPVDIQQQNTGKIASDDADQVKERCQKREAEQ